MVEAAFSEAVARRGGRVVAIERYPHDRTAMQQPIKTVAQAAAAADALFIPDGADAVPAVAQLLNASGAGSKRLQLLGTGLWDDPRIFAEPVAARRLVSRRPSRPASRVSPAATARNYNQDPVAHRDACL